MLTSLPGSPQTIDDMIQKVPSELPDQFPFLLDVNAGRPIGLGENFLRIFRGLSDVELTTYCTMYSLVPSKYREWNEEQLSDCLFIECLHQSYQPTRGIEHEGFTNPQHIERLCSGFYVH